MNKILSGIVMLLLFCVTVLGQGKKYIGHGWDTLGVTPTEIANNLDELDTCGLDGITIVIQKKLSTGEKLHSLHIQTDPLWTKEKIADQIPILQKISSKVNLRHCFLTCFWSPTKRLDWEDDQAWERFSNNMGVLAWLAKQGGMRGILVDPEDYYSTKQFYIQSDDISFEKMSRIARKRGTEVFSRIFKEYPDITFFSFFLYSLDTTYVNSISPLEAMRNKGDLWPSFLNGMLDVIPSSARFIDGNEHAYLYEAKKRDFYYSAWSQQMGVLPLIAPENRDKYKTQLLVGFGLYLDMYTNTDSKGTYYFGPISGSRLFHLAQNLGQATQVSSEYIWLYGEKYSWIPWKGISNKKYQTQGTWDQKLPGLKKTLLMTKDRKAFMEKKLRRKYLKNLIKNGVCAPTQKFEKRRFHQGKVPEPFHTWQNNESGEGVFGIDTSCGEGDASSLCAMGVGWGCFLVDLIPVKAGEQYIIEASAKGPKTTMTIQWQKDGKWQWQIPSIHIPIQTGNKDQWRKGRDLITIPKGTDHLVFLLGVKQKKGEQTWFDNVHIYKVDMTK